MDILNTIARNLNNNKKIQNSFWDLTANSYYDLIVIESFKLVDNKKNLSVFSLINQVKGVRPMDIEELNEDYKELKKLIDADDFKLIQHRHNQKAHHSKKHNDLPRYANLNETIQLIDVCQKLISKYNLWIKGSKYSIDLSTSSI